MRIKIHYLKLQNGLFTSLENSGNTTECIKLMWFLQDSVLEKINILIKSLETYSSCLKAAGICDDSIFNLNSFNKAFGEMYLTAASLIYREEKILYPLVFEYVPDDERQQLISEITALGLL